MISEYTFAGKIFIFTIAFSIQFSDGKAIKLLKLLEPILVSSKFRGIPKLVICQFCRGGSMNSTAIMDNRVLSDIVSGQEGSE